MVGVVARKFGTPRHGVHENVAVFAVHFAKLFNAVKDIVFSLACAVAVKFVKFCVKFAAVYFLQKFVFSHYSSSESSRSTAINASGDT